MLSASRALPLSVSQRYQFAPIRINNVSMGDIMLDDLAEETAKGIFRIIFEILFRIIVEFLLFYTGEFILFIVTFGYRKPRWDYYAKEKPSKFVIFTEISIWIGFAFWLSVAWFINSKLLNV